MIAPRAAHRRLGSVYMAPEDFAWADQAKINFTGLEQGSLLYKLKDMGYAPYSYSPSAFENSILRQPDRADEVPAGAEVVGLIHTHPKQQSFSERDIGNMRDKQDARTQYGILPSGDEKERQLTGWSGQTGR